MLWIMNICTVCWLFENLKKHEQKLILIARRMNEFLSPFMSVNSFCFSFRLDRLFDRKKRIYVGYFTIVCVSLIRQSRKNEIIWCIMKWRCVKWGMLPCFYWIVCGKISICLFFKFGDHERYKESIWRRGIYLGTPLQGTLPYPTLHVRDSRWRKGTS